MAFWAFCLGYLISAMIQVFVTEARMRRVMGRSGVRSVALGTFFGFVSSSCSFAALSTTRALFQKGAGLVPSLAFLLASTNLVIELGVLIFVFLSWQFVVGEYAGGLLLIAVMWLMVRFTLTSRLEDEARRHVEEDVEEEVEREVGGDDDADEAPDWRRLATSLEGWRRVAHRFFMEWGMVWRDVMLGFSVAGAIAAFVPTAFFRALFIGSGDGAAAAGWAIAAQTLIGPIAAFFTFIGSMGNIPLAAILFGSGVGFAGVMAFIFSDLVVYPVVRISARYFGWRMALYIVGVFFFSLVVTSWLLHAGFAWLGWLPDPALSATRRIAPGDRFALDCTFFLNLAFALLALVLAALARPWRGRSIGWEAWTDGQSGFRAWTAVARRLPALLASGWLLVGMALALLEPGSAGS